MDRGKRRRKEHRGGRRRASERASGTVSSEWRDFRRARTKRACVLFRHGRGPIAGGKREGPRSRGLVPRPSRIVIPLMRTHRARFVARAAEFRVRLADRRETVSVRSFFSRSAFQRSDYWNEPRSPRCTPRLFVAERPISWLSAFPSSPKREFRQRSIVRLDRQTLATELPLSLSPFSFHFRIFRKTLAINGIGNSGTEFHRRRGGT